MPGPPPKRQLHGYVSTQARDGWYAFAEAQGTNVTALLEAVGRELKERAKQPRAKLPPWLKKLADDAQLIASGRSSRRRSD
jgi:hypothetical protein